MGGSPPGGPKVLPPVQLLSAKPATSGLNKASGMHIKAVYYSIGNNKAV